MRAVQVHFSGRGRAVCLPDINGQRAQSLWDSGADLTLMLDTLVDKLVKLGARKQQLAHHVRITGVGDGEVIATHQVICTVRFADGKSRVLVGLVVPNCPWEVIIGRDFMHQERLAYEPAPDGHFVLTDLSVNGRPCVYESAKFEDVKTPSARGCHFGKADSTHELSDKEYEKFVKRWKYMTDSDRLLVQ